jgi:hypothetical protein
MILFAVLSECLQHVSIRVFESLQALLNLICRMSKYWKLLIPLKSRRGTSYTRGCGYDGSTAITAGIYYNEEDRIVRMLIWVVLILTAPKESKWWPTMGRNMSCNK